MLQRIRRCKILISVFLVLLLLAQPVSAAAHKSVKQSVSRTKQAKHKHKHKTVSKKSRGKTSKHHGRKHGRKHRRRGRAHYVSSAESTQQKQKIAAITVKLENEPDLSGDVPELSADKLVWPLRYGYISRSVRGGHSGVDMMCYAGYPVYAVADGVVETIRINDKNYRGYGKMAIIRHDDKQLWSIYSHCSAIYLREGQTVKRGQKIAAVGRTGRTTSDHLHFELRGMGGKVLDPLKYLPEQGALGTKYVPH